MRKILNSKGSLTVEAALFLPVFIIAVLTIGFIMKIFYVQEYVQHALADETTKIAAEAYMTSPSQKVLSTLGIDKICDPEKQISSKISERISEDLQFLHIEDTPETKHFSYLFDGRYESLEEGHLYRVNTDDLIDVALTYQVSTPFSIRFTENFNLIQRVTVRAWTGVKEKDHPIDFETMAEEGEVVYIFPRAGQRYHQKNCTTITNHPSLYIMTEKINSQYDPCKLCKARQLKIGDDVYVYKRSGEVFHSKECPLVDKYVVAIPLEDAKEKNYTPCKLCVP